MALPADVQAILDTLEPQLREAFKDAIANITNATQIRLVEDALRGGDIRAAIQAIQLDASFYARIDRVIGEIFWQGGMTVAANLPLIASPFPGAASFSVSMRAIIARRNGSDDTRET